MSSTSFHLFPCIPQRSDAKSQKFDAPSSTKSNLQQQSMNAEIYNILDSKKLTGYSEGFWMPTGEHEWQLICRTVMVYNCLISCIVRRPLGENCAFRS